MLRYVCVLTGGAAGSLTRYLVGRAFVQRFPNATFPAGTLIINVSGSFFIGIFVSLLIERLRLSSYWYLTGVVGFLGGYTTFSSFEYDGLLLSRSGHHWFSLLYLVGSVVLGYGAVWLGSALGSKL